MLMRRGLSASGLAVALAFGGVGVTASAAVEGAGGCVTVDGALQCSTGASESTGGGETTVVGGGAAGTVTRGTSGSQFATDYAEARDQIDGWACLSMGPAVPQPPFSHPAWGGRTDGTVYQCVTINVSTGVMGARFFWVGAGAAAPVIIPPPDPRVLAQRAVDQMGFQPIQIGIVPEAQTGRVGVIGLPTWMWAANAAANTTGPNSLTVSERGFSVTANASLDRIVWTMGDGTTITCGLGTPYADSYGTQPSPDCGHRYSKPGTYNVSATSYWTVRWQGIGQSGTISLDRTSNTQIRMGEVQVLNQHG